jgi:hypothetical protein
MKRHCTKEDNEKILGLLKEYRQTLISMGDGICAFSAPIGGMANMLYNSDISEEIDEIIKKIERLIKRGKNLK